MAELQFIDVSKWNTFTDYDKVAEQIPGVVFRAGYRSLSAGKLMVDPMFEKHYAGFFAKVKYLGVYFFTTAINAQEAREEADYCVKLIKEKYINMPIFVDSEMSNGTHTGRSDQLSKAQRTICIKAFCDRIRELGMPAGIYASDSWFISQLDWSKISDGNYIWVASYSYPPKRTPRYDAWQYTSNLQLPGSKTRLDCSYWYNAPELDKYKLGITGVNRDGSLKEEVKVEDIKPTSVKVDTTTGVKKFATGESFVGDGVDLYTASLAFKPKRKLEGVYFIWSTKEINGRIRITNKKENAGRNGQVTGWVNYEDIARQFSS